MKINFDSGDELPLNKTIEISMIILVTAILFFFFECNKYYSQVFLDECFYKLYTVI